MEKHIHVDRVSTGISIMVNNEEKHVIKDDHMEITGEEIFKALDFQKGESLRLQKGSNVRDNDDALNFFYELLKEIVDSVNQKNGGEELT